MLFCQNNYRPYDAGRWLIKNYADFATRSIGRLIKMHQNLSEENSHVCHTELCKKQKLLFNINADFNILGSNKRTCKLEYERQFFYTRITIKRVVSVSHRLCVHFQVVSA